MRGERFFRAPHEFRLQEARRKGALLSDLDRYSFFSRHLTYPGRRRPWRSSRNATRDRGGTRSFEPRAGSRTSSARTNRKPERPDAWADWRTSCTPSNVPIAREFLDGLARPLVDGSRKRRYRLSRRPDDRSSRARPMENGGGICHTCAFHLASN